MGGWEFHGAVPRLGQPRPSTAPATGSSASGLKSDAPTPDTTNTPSSSSAAGQPRCFELVSPMNPYSRRPVPCHLEKTVKKPLARPKNASLNGKMLKSAAGSSVPRGLDVTLTCRAKNEEICNKARSSFEMASAIIGNVLVLNEPLTVNATIYPFCAENSDLCSKEFQLLGGASPARTMLRKDDDGFYRIYPQSLVKQLNHTQHPSYGSFDISAEFNADGNFWFQEDGAIKKGQSDFLFVVVHEMIHGLGFTTSWADYINKIPSAITPNPLSPDADPLDTDTFRFDGFFENAFDRHLVQVPSMVPLSNLTRVLNRFNGGIGTVYKDQIEFINKLTQSPEYEMAARAFNLSTTRGSLGFLPSDSVSGNDVVLMETNLKSGFVQGSSISHVEYQTYSNTPDFLMRYLQDPGTLLQQDIEGSGNYAGGAIGPKLIRCLQTLGYRINKNPQRIAMYQIQSESGADSMTALRGYASWHASLAAVAAVTLAALL
ncbi:hypothetical protein THASP1DRAFT_24377 [Thamnocephalis sphaerospora]|uniref:Sequence orphan n=1 Tax=Thamnocephalis sphaerospora TaxID=78915 RepID=A0A4P9XNF4_9FUNG|nr:hypothetical protein THASP1DRAFT_24377 [Thamnocephalis sphaerospora]|eukprot:RKP07484.1 hypothetical protein THASP1DRAFT_24377 [Thamnocephalis sphaerospora]